MLIVCYNILGYTTDITGHEVKFNDSGNRSIIQAQFTINVRTTVYKHIIIIYIYFQIKGFPHLCNVTDVNETTLYYNITGLHPSLYYTFTAYIIDLYNNTKDEDHIIFFELVTCFFNMCH